MGSTTAQGTHISDATSVKLVRNLMRTAVAEVVYARGLLPPDNFELIEMCDVQLHAVRDAPDVVGAPIFRNLAEGVLGALARGVGPHGAQLGRRKAVGREEAARVDDRGGGGAHEVAHELDRRRSADVRTLRGR